jgi:hypothetical protein
MFTLGLSGGGGNYIRFSPSINAWQLGKDEIDLKKIVFDLDSIKTGWGMMAEGQAPQWVWDASVGQRSLQPEGEFKRGFSVRVWLGPDRGWAEWSSTGTGPGMGFETLAVEVMALKADNPGKVVVCTYEGSSALKVGKGNTRVPKFKLVGWIDRPADDGDEDIPPHDHPVTQRAAPPATGSRAVPPPSKKATADLSDFG